MSNATHYTALGLAQTAAPEVIRAAYRALSLICHPDKTLHLAAGERVSRAAVFNEVQAAYDVLGNPTLKAAYDADLARQNNKTEKTSYPQSSVRTASEPSSKPKRRMIVRITTPEEKAAMQAKVHQSLDYLRQQRIERDSEDANLDISGLKGWARTWKKLAEDNRIDPAMYAHCVIRVYEYEQKIADREQQHKEWLVNISTAKQERPTAAVKQRQATEGAPRRPRKSSLRASTHSDNASCVHSEYGTATSTTTTAAFRGPARAEERKRAENEHAVELTARAQARTTEKTRREASKQAHIDQKAAAVRGEKVKLKAKVELQARQTAERITKARAKAGAAPLGTVGVVIPGGSDKSAPPAESVGNNIAPLEAHTKANEIRGNLGVKQMSFRE